jgi:hypothetical protein
VLIAQRRRRQVLAHMRGAEEYLLKHRLPQHRAGKGSANKPKL